MDMPRLRSIIKEIIFFHAQKMGIYSLSSESFILEIDYDAIVDDILIAIDVEKNKE